MNQRERMEQGLPYRAWEDGLSELRTEAQDKCFHYNQMPPSETEQRDTLIRSIIGSAKEHVHILSPFYCDYGKNIEVGEWFFSNVNCVMIDVGKITIGDDTMFGPNCCICTAGHPIHPTSRSSGYEYGQPITIGNNVWLGSNVVVNPGVTIGDNCVIGAGSVVTKDIPANSLAYGVPCRVARSITDDDRKYYYHDRVFDVEDY